MSSKFISNADYAAQEILDNAKLPYGVLKSFQGGFNSSECSRTDLEIEIKQLRKENQAFALVIENQNHVIKTIRLLAKDIKNSGYRT